MMSGILMSWTRHFTRDFAIIIYSRQGRFKDTGHRENPSASVVLVVGRLPCPTRRWTLRLGTVSSRRDICWPSEGSV
jgi:hypothetical protein